MRYSEWNFYIMFFLIIILFRIAYVSPDSNGSLRVIPIAQANILETEKTA